MKLSDLLRQLNADDLNKLARNLDLLEYAQDSSALVIRKLDQTIRSPRHIELTISMRRPPVLAMLQVLLECTENSLGFSDFKHAALQMDQELTELVSNGHILGSEGNGLYRRVFAEAWRNDLRLDASEVSVLGVLRHELGMSHIDHYLTAQHREVAEYWQTSDPFDTVFSALADNGILYLYNEQVYLPSDLIEDVRNSLGLPMPFDSLRRLLGYLSNDVMQQALRNSELKISGSKDDRLDRLIENMISPLAILSNLSLVELQELADNDLGCKKSGSKEDLIHRIVKYVATNLDLQSASSESEAALEPKKLSIENFEYLFGQLSGSELTLILIKISAKRQTGVKASKISALWTAPQNEKSLLGCLNLSALRDMAQSIGVGSHGNKAELLDRLINNHQSS